MQCWFGVCWIAGGWGGSYSDPFDPYTAAGQFCDSEMMQNPEND